MEEEIPEPGKKITQGQLGQWLSSCIWHQNHPRRLAKHRLLGPTPGVWFRGAGVGPENLQQVPTWCWCRWSWEYSLRTNDLFRSLPEPEWSFCSPPFASSPKMVDIRGSVTVRILREIGQPAGAVLDPGTECPPPPSLAETSGSFFPASRHMTPWFTIMLVFYYWPSPPTSAHNPSETTQTCLPPVLGMILTLSYWPKLTL